MKIQESVKVPTAKHVITKKPSVDASHITTQGFLTPQPIFIKECVPNMRFDLSCESFTRLNPMPVPTFGRCNVSNRAFFVPFRTIMPKFNEFLEAEPVWHNASNQFGLASGVPVISNDAFVSYFINFGSSAGTSGSHDFYDGNNYYIFSAEGRFAYKLLLSLGYQVLFDSHYTATYSAMPLLAWAKVFLDWYFPSAYVNSAIAVKLQMLLDDDSLSQQLTYLDLNDIVKATCRCSYNDDYFVSAWDNPVAPNNSAEHSISMPDITNNYPYLSSSNGTTNVTGESVDNTSNANGTPSVNSFLTSSGGTSYSSATVVRLNQYIVDTLKSLTDYTKRHQMAGVRTVDRYLAEYGVNLSSEIMKRSIYLGSDSFDINFMDVMSMADTTQSGSSDGDVLGAYAGKGVGYGNKRFSYDLGQEFGYFIIVNSIIPDVGYYQGVDRQNMHVTAMDFYHGDFDNQGVQAISKPELYLPVDCDANFTNSYTDAVFGFIPRYAEYKVLKSKLSGLYTCPTSNLGMDAYYMYRDCSGQPNDIGHDASFVIGIDNQQYQRIFYNAKTDEDQFNFIHHFVLTSVDDMLPLWDTYEFKDEDEHEKVTIHPNGAKLN